MTTQIEMTVEANDAALCTIDETMAYVRANSDAALHMINEALVQMKAKNEAFLLMAHGVLAQIKADDPPEPKPQMN